MAILEDVPDSPPLRNRKPAQKSRSESKSKSSKKASADSQIPLKHPSSVPPPSSPPLLDVSTPGSVPAGVVPQYVSSEEEIEALNASLEPQRCAVHGHDHDHGDVDDSREDEIFNTLIMAVPFTFLYLLLDILVHLQYSHRPGYDLLINHLIKAFPTNRHAGHFTTNSALMAASILSGCRLIWLVNKASWSVVTAQAPPMGTLWILTIIQLPLGRAVMCLMIVGGWIWRSGLSIAP
ncbi:hypothetical protein IAR50_003532 [Cryptococcus sp. DSM 104548]